MSSTFPLDHLVFATPDLARTVEEVAELTGVRPVEGGSHPGLGTRNYLLGTGNGGYLEIVGPDEGQPAPDGPRWFGIDALTGPRLVHWAVRVPDIDARVAGARERGYDPGEPVAMARATPEGGTISWRLTMPLPHGHDRGGDGLVPFLLDWGTTVHPSERGLPVLPLLAFTARHPEPDRVADELAALGAGLEIFRGTVPALTAVLDGRHGPVTFGDGITSADATTPPHGHERGVTTS
ncbi:VOC family protein [Streptomyces poonensis]|uniref:VOC family protein n=1 Tax=Streptomyces poonensis TaxID=68255 RepID=UPI00167C393D|nr:VOC family protein [Streptomyces poonensis]